MESDSLFRMIDVGAKTPTFRRAVAQGRILLSPESYSAVKDKTNPKGNVLALAEVAGILMAKKASELIPLCHPLSLDRVKISFELEPESHSILTFCEASAFAKTGVEMEALAGVQGALLSIYDLSKAVHPAIRITDIQLNSKEGGKSGKWVHGFENTLVHDDLLSLRTIESAVVTISDRVSQAKMEDRSGPAIHEFLHKHGSKVLGSAVVPDDKKKIQAAVLKAIDEGARLVLTTGGTGLGPRDLTPEAIAEISQRVLPGLGELLRKSGAHYSEFSWLSGSMGAILGTSLVIALPGSCKAVMEGLEALLPLLPHALQTLQGGNHE